MSKFILAKGTTYPNNIFVIEQVNSSTFIKWSTGINYSVLLEFVIDFFEDSLDEYTNGEELTPSTILALCEEYIDSDYLYESIPDYDMYIRLGDFEKIFHYQFNFREFKTHSLGEFIDIKDCRDYLLKEGILESF